MNHFIYQSKKIHATRAQTREDMLFPKIAKTCYCEIQGCQIESGIIFSFFVEDQVFLQRLKIRPKMDKIMIDIIFQVLAHFYNKGFVIKDCIKNSTSFKFCRFTVELLQFVNLDREINAGSFGELKIDKITIGIGFYGISGVSTIQSFENNEKLFNVRVIKSITPSIRP